MKYFKELSELVSQYSKIKDQLDLLEKQTALINLQKNQIELDLSKIKEAEKSLIDKIVEETGQQPDFYELLQKLNAHEN